MKECGRCHAVVPDTTMKCAACGALVVAPPPVPVKVGAGAPASSSQPAPSSIDPFGVFGDNPMAGVFVKPPPAPATKPSRSIGMVVAAIIVVLALGTAVYPMLRGSNGASNTSSDAPVVLDAAEPMSGGLPGLSQAVRVQAESTRQLAFAAIMQNRTANGAIDLRMLQQTQPDLTWLGANQSSTGPKEVSLTTVGDDVIIAVSASNKTVCAFGRLPIDGAGEYVTMGNMHSCAATDAPTTGWTQLAGGYGGTPPLDG